MNNKNEIIINFIDYLDKKIRFVGDKVGGDGDEEPKQKKDELLIPLKYFKVFEKLRKNDFEQYKQIIEYWEKNKQMLKSYKTQTLPQDFVKILQL